MKRTTPIRWTTIVLAVIAVAAMSRSAAAADFPYDREMLLDADPMPGTRRVPVLEVRARGDATIDLWCNSVRAQFVVAGNTVTILTGAKTDRQCQPALMRGDDTMLATLETITTWQRDGNILVLRGGKSLRFRMATN